MSSDTSLFVVALLLCCMIGIAAAGCSLDTALGQYTCGEHGQCKQAKLSRSVTFRYCSCDAGYEGDKTCNAPCVDCCQQLYTQCYRRRIRSLCKLPRCLKKVLNNRHCPADSPARKSIVIKMQSYTHICQLKPKLQAA